jgi:hypothetical protein
MGTDTALWAASEWISDAIGGTWIQSASADLYMDVQWGQSAAGTPVWLWDYNGSGAQHWSYDSNT